MSMGKAAAIVIAFAAAPSLSEAMPALRQPVCLAHSQGGKKITSVFVESGVSQQAHLLVGVERARSRSEQVRPTPVQVISPEESHV